TLSVHFSYFSSYNHATSHIYTLSLHDALPISYPCEFLENDIDNHALYILLKGSEILAAFSLYNSNLGAKSIQWSTNSNKVFYLDRLGVNISYSRAGIGSLMLLKAQETARNMGAEYLRLFVVTNNTPTISL